jgi:MbtH protein
MSGADDKTPGAASIDGDDFVVLVNDEGQHSIWPGRTAVPEGWSAVGPRGPKDICIAYIEANWTDMRPRSLTAGSKRKAAAKK